MEELTTDILIIGGGIAGSAMAASLKSTKFHITLLDDSKHTEFLNKGDILWPTSIDICQSWTSTDFFENQGIQLSDVSLFYNNKYIKSYSERLNSEFGSKAISIEYPDITRSLQSAASSNNFLFIHGMECTKILEGTHGYKGIIAIGLGKELQINARLIIAADGENSFVRNAVAIKQNVKRYRIKAVIFTMPLRGSFEPGKKIMSGIATPLTMQLLPNNKLLVSLYMDEINRKIWTGKTKKEKYAYLCSQSHLFQQTTAEFHNEQIYTFTSSLAKQLWLKNIVLIGEAAHSSHPIMSLGPENAIEDAYLLSKILNNSLELIPTKLEKYATLRLESLKKINRYANRIGSFLVREAYIKTVTMDIFFTLFPSIPLLQTVTDYNWHRFNETLRQEQNLYNEE